MVRGRPGRRGAGEAGIVGAEGMDGKLVRVMVGLPGNAAAAAALVAAAERGEKVGGLITGMKAAVARMGPVARRLVCRPGRTRGLAWPWAICDLVACILAVGNVAACTAATSRAGCASAGMGSIDTSMAMAGCAAVLSGLGTAGKNGLVVTIVILHQGGWWGRKGSSV